MNAFVEGYGCSLNHSDTLKIKSFLELNKYTLSSNPETADVLVINTCAVKLPTENKMLRRISELEKFAKKNNALLVVFGCLTKINPDLIPVSKNIVSCGPCLEELALILSLPPKRFSPLLPSFSVPGDSISILPISRGCLGECSFCAVRNARGPLKSYSVQELADSFKQSLSSSTEIWVTSQDTACYGADIGSSLPELISTFLETKGNYRLRIGMMNPGRILPVLDKFLDLFEDKRIYKFLHIPLQSGSDSVLERMNRPYSVEEFHSIVSAAKKRFPEISISTDVIVGFPGETEQEFNETVSALKKAEPYITNISRYGDRPNTSAEKMPDKIIDREKKQRSRQLSTLCSSFSLEQKKLLVGTKQEILVSATGNRGNFIGRTNSYKQVAVTENRLGGFCNVFIEKAFPTYLSGKLVE